MSGYSYQLQSTSERYYVKIKAYELAKIKGWPEKCFDCGLEFGLTIHHKLPRSVNPKAKGYLANYSLLCGKCNEKRGNAKKHF